MKSVVIVLHEQNLQFDKTYTVPCVNDGVDGVVLKDIPDGVYHHDIYAKTGGGGAVVSLLSWGDDDPYEFDEHRLTPLFVDLEVPGTVPDNVFISWRFPASPSNPTPTCIEENVYGIVVDFDGDITGRGFGCGPGPSDEVGVGVYTKHLTPGAHTGRIIMVDKSGTDIYSARLAFVVPAIGLAYIEVPLAVGPLEGPPGSPAVNE